MKTDNINTFFLGTLAILATGGVLHLLQRVFIPLVLAILLSFILMPIVKRLLKWHIPRVLAIILVILLLFIGIYLIAMFLYGSTQSFMERLGFYQSRFDQIIATIWTQLDLPDEVLASFNWTSTLQSQALSLSGSFVSFVGTLGMVILFVIFMLIEDPLSFKKLRYAFPEGRTSVRISRMIRDITQQVSRYLTVKLLISSGTGILVGVTLWLIGLDFALMWGVFAVLLNFIPNIGSMLVMIITIVMSLIQFYPDWNPIIATMIIMPIIQVLMGNILDPKLSGDQLDLSPLFILISLVFWGWIWGIVGMFLAVPLLGTMKIICANISFLRPISIIIGTGKTAGAAARK